MAEGRSRILYIAESINACAWYRCVTPGRALLALGHGVRVDEAITAQSADWADVVVFQRVHNPTIGDAIRHCRAAGKLTVYEIDDDLWNVHRDSAAHSFYARPEVLHATQDGLRLCDLVTTTTTPLAVRLKAMNRQVRVLPNMLPDKFWAFDEPVEQTEDRIVIGWAGSNTHLPDLKLLSGVVEQLLDRYDNVEFAWAGMQEVPLRRHERMRMLDPVSLEEYPQLLGNFHIGLAPVVDSVFNESKSDLKYLEYARRGIPVVASRTVAYSGTIQHGVNGFLAKNAKDWLQLLTRLIEDVELRRRIGAAGMDYARTRMISTNVGLWEKAYGL